MCTFALLSFQKPFQTSEIMEGTERDAKLQLAATAFWLPPEAQLEGSLMCTGLELKVARKSVSSSVFLSSQSSTANTLS